MYFQKKMPIFAIQIKKLKITIMKKNCKITIFTTEEVIERKFYTTKVAISTILEYKKNFDDFKIGILSEKINGEWHCIYIMENNSNK